MRVFELAAEANGELRIRRAPAAERSPDGPSHREPPRPVRQLNNLGHDLLGRSKRRMNVPKRASPPVTGERKPPRRKPLRNIAGSIHTHEEERNAFGTWPSKGREPVRDLLEAGAESRPEHFDIETQRLRRLMEPAVWHHERPGEVVSKRDTQQASRGA